MVHQDGGDKETKDNKGTNDKNRWRHAHNTTTHDQPSRHYSHHNKTGKTNHEQPSNSEHQTKTDTNTTEMTLKTCTQDIKTPTTRSHHRQEPVDPNTTPSPHPHHHHTSDSENTQVIRVRKQGETTKKMEKTKSLTQINFGPISQWNNLLKWQQKVRAGSQGQTQISKYWPINDQILNLIPVFKVFTVKKRDNFGSTSAPIPVGGSIKRQPAWMNDGSRIAIAQYLLGGA